MLEKQHAGAIDQPDDLPRTILVESELQRAESGGGVARRFTKPGATRVTRLQDLQYSFPRQLDRLSWLAHLQELRARSILAGRRPALTKSGMRKYHASDSHKNTLRPFRRERHRR